MNKLNLRQGAVASDFVVYSHEDCLLHEPGPTHPERPDRLTRIMHRLQTNAYTAHCPYIRGRAATVEELCRVHDRSYVEAAPGMMPEQGITCMDESTLVCPESYEAALVAAGTVCAAVEDVMEGRVGRAFCAVRPPGHHAPRGHAMEFCVFNNLAVGVAHAIEKYGLERIAIVDWDAHDGNGTQDIFKDRSEVLYISLHQEDIWNNDPEVSRTSGNVMNFVIPPDGPAEMHHDAFDKIIPALHAYAPQVIFISAGFDSHRDDRFAPESVYNMPPAMLNLTAPDYEAFTRRLMECAQICCDGRIVSVLEGGYNLSALTESVLSHVTALSNAGTVAIEMEELAAA
jgi:acetoin utilization deacetylase AcuC-like enzyme